MVCLHLRCTGTISPSLKQLSYMLYDKEVLFFMAIGMLVFLLLVFSVIGFIIYYNRKQVAFYKERQIMQARFSEELLRTQLEIQEQTLQNISQEIHDNIGQ